MTTCASAGSAKRTSTTCRRCPATEAEALLAAHESKMCVRLYKRSDGTVLTDDCPVGVKRARRRRALTAAGGGGVLAAAAAGATRTTVAEGAHPPTTGMVAVDHEPIMGDIAVTPAVAPPEMGSAAPAQTTPPYRALMGKISVSPPLNRRPTSR